MQQSQQAILITNIGLLATPEGTSASQGQDQGKVRLLEDAYIKIKDGVIAEIGSNQDLAKDDTANYHVLDAQGSLVTPGLVDPHTHLVFAGWRQKELALKLKGMSYLDILQMGGGILDTVRNTRAASHQELEALALTSLDRMVAHGTTTCEVKSGYGLDLPSEIKSLQVIQELNKKHPVDLVPTFMGAHAVPPEYKDKVADYVRVVNEEMIPEVARLKLAEFNDVFCEQGVFDLEQSREILECGQKYGLTPKAHAEELTALGGASMAAQVGAISAEHLIHATDQGIEDMSQSGTIAVLLPATSLNLGAKFARARDMIAAGVPVALATDFNPGSCPTESLQLIMNLACMKYKLTPEEVLTAVTLNAAAAINRADSIGTLEPGKQADVVLWDAPDLDFIMYRFGTNLVKTVVKKGQVFTIPKKLEPVLSCNSPGGK
ncbi:MAG TPA: imidazolonepropionase [Firmicutes bacterium]|nr:imidazolonepropionase [Bacillota bacterium]